MATNEPSTPFELNRPEFMATLGLLPPYSAEDIKRAYFEKAKTAHPDHSGDAADFIKLHDAYEKAMEYAGARSGKMRWLGSWVERYAEQQTLIEQVHELGGLVSVEFARQVQHSLGEDFSQVMESINAIQLKGREIRDDAIELLISKRHLLGTLRRLNMSECAASDAGLRRLTALQGLRRIDLSRTNVGKGTVRLLMQLPELELLILDGTRIGWWQRFIVRWKLRRKAIASA